MNRRLKMSMFAVLLLAAAAIADTGGLCGLRAGCHTRENYGRCIQCCYGAQCQIDSCIAFCWNRYKRWQPGQPARPPYDPHPRI